MAKQEVRTVRVTPSQPKEVEKAKQRSVSELLTIAKQEEKLGEYLTEEEVLAAIDAGGELDLSQKQMAADVKLLKDMVMTHARKNKWKTKVGERCSCTIKPSSSTIINPAKMLSLLVKLGKKKLFDTVFKVQITAAKDFLGKEEIKDISQTETEEFGSASFKSMK